MTTPQPQHSEVAGTVFEEGAVEIGRSYALALLNVVTDQGQADAVLGELDELERRCRDDLARLRTTVP